MNKKWVKDYNSLIYINNRVIINDKKVKCDTVYKKNS